MSGGFQRPRLPAIRNVKMPDGWGTTSRNPISAFGSSFNEPDHEPAGDPPENFPGSRPEWAIWWALESLGLVPQQDFGFQTQDEATGRGAFTEWDFELFDLGIAIEVQGEFWHHRSRDQQARDLLRGETAAQRGLTLIYIDEPDALKRPIQVVQDALRGIDNSWMRRKV